MNRKDIISYLEKVGLPYEGYWVLAGAALVMHNIRLVTNDIDIGCTSDYFDMLAENNDTVRLLDDGNRTLVYRNNIEVFENWNVSRIINIDGIPVANINCLKQHKIQLGREKDIQDIQLIDKYIEKMNNTDKENYL